ncbi:uncharacterized protein LY79DRAFT_544604 [Colletotrichum navitas]|uniref:Uncharacterized protein n=1 Tax=Colletotrichum navitas TaxID=681940 RepID=A0AAD8Q5P2_9PEZI|nr:uncharacterized protein LY79DRAFT_544604 [Colletotrichum navitas]KAK1596370.1 hypothetical protein LY79DRAFT_544604 [Colletotrichum navitas]
MRGAADAVIRDTAPPQRQRRLRLNSILAGLCLLGNTVQLRSHRYTIMILAQSEKHSISPVVKSSLSLGRREQ